MSPNCCFAKNSTSQWHTLVKVAQPCFPQAVSDDSLPSWRWISIIVNMLFFFLWYCTKNFLIFISSPHPTSSPTLSFLVNQKLPRTLKRKISPIYPQSRVQLQKVPYITLPLLFSVKMFLLLTQIASLLHLSLASSTAKHLVMMWDCFCEGPSCPELPN